MIYLDYNATCPLEIEVQRNISDALKDLWGNPSSNYSFGKSAKNAIKESREQVAKMINCKCEEILFTSGGTEANNLVVHSALNYYQINKIETTTSNVPNCVSEFSCKPHVIVSAIEHDSVKLPLEILCKENQLDLSFIPIDSKTGCVNADELFDSIKANTCLISVMLANNETGVIQPIQEISERLKTVNQNRSANILFHTDAAQGIGKVPVNVADLNVDYLTIVGHKFYGPRIGALFVKDLNSANVKPMFYGGGQERNYRPGTENTPMIVGLGKACELVSINLHNYENHLREIRDYLELELKTSCNAIIHFENSRRLPNTCSVSFPKFAGSGADLLRLCSATFCASTGAACHSDGPNASHVLLTCGMDLELAKRTIRLSVGRETSKADIDLVVKTIENVLLS